VTGAVVVLDLQDLDAGMPALTSAMGSVLRESAAICLDFNRHASPVRLHLKKVSNAQVLLSWPSVTAQMKATYNDMQNSTEFGACGIAILVVRKITGLTVIEQSKKGTGFDYWLGADEDDEVLPFANKARLEVSGILSGTPSQFKARIKQKLRQTETSDSSGLTAYAVVVEFSKPLAEIGKR
jgi:hypothetical protein